jgi:cytochrome bd-type quinol oxidase subunit 2
MLVGIGMLFPVMLVYNGYQYLVLGGKVGREYGESTAPKRVSHGSS